MIDCLEVVGNVVRYKGNNVRYEYLNTGRMIQMLLRLVIQLLFVFHSVRVI